MSNNEFAHDHLINKLVPFYDSILSRKQKNGRKKVVKKCTIFISKQQHLKIKWSFVVGFFSLRSIKPLLELRSFLTLFAYIISFGSWLANFNRTEPLILCWEHYTDNVRHKKRLWVLLRRERASEQRKFYKWLWTGDVFVANFFFFHGISTNSNRCPLKLSVNVWWKAKIFDKLPSTFDLTATLELWHTQRLNLLDATVTLLLANDWVDSKTPVLNCHYY